MRAYSCFSVPISSATDKPILRPTVQRQATSPFAAPTKPLRPFLTACICYSPFCPPAWRLFFFGERASLLFFWALHHMNIMLILHLVLLVAIGAAMGLITRYYHPGPTPLDAVWSVVSGIIGAAIVSLFGAQIGLYELGDFMYYASAPTGALIGVMVYAVIITKDEDEDEDKGENKA